MRPTSSGSADFQRRLRRTRTFRRDRRGAAAVEFAFVCPLLLMLLFGTLILGQALYSISSVQWAVERSVRALMIDGSLSQTDLETRVKETLKDLTNFDFKIQYTEDESLGIPTVRVFTDLIYRVSLPLVPEFDVAYTVDTLVPRPFDSEGGIVELTQ